MQVQRSHAYSCKMIDSKLTVNEFQLNHIASYKGIVKWQSQSVNIKTFGRVYNHALLT